MHRLNVSACLTVSVWLSLLVACQQQLSEPSAIEPTLKTAAVVGGKEVSVCQFPSTVRVGGCTGTLIHPRVVTTAAHCLNGASASIRFGGGRNDPASFTLMGECTSGARGQSGVGANRDWGYCVLPEDERLKQLPITPPLVGCEAERYLKPGANAWIVGYGTTGPSGQGGGVKRAVEVKVNRVGDGTVDVGDREVGACHGDSGGPIYLQLTDGANDYGLRVFGSTSGPGAAFCDCSCSTLYVDIAMHVKAIEENEGIDVTPCTDADGKWAPGPDCKDLQTQAMMGSGTFPSCSVARTTAPIDSCGEGAVPVAGSGGSSGAPAAAGNGAAGSGVSGAAGMVATVAAAGSGGSLGATAAAGSGGVTGSPGIGATAQSNPSTSGAGSIATGMSTQGVTAAGGPATGVVPVVAVEAPSPDEDRGCSAAKAPRSADRTGGLLCGLFVGWMVLRARRRTVQSCAKVTREC
jgi:hypothetical protein